MARIYISPSTQEWNLYRGGSNEEVEMRSTASRVVAMLLEAGHEVKLGGRVSWSANVAEGNAYKPSAYIAIHSDAGGGTGTTLYVKPNNAKGLALAKTIYARLAPVSIGAPDRGIRTTTTLGEINRPTAPYVCLMELEYHDNLAGANDIKANRERYARAIADGIIAVFGGTTTVFDAAFVHRFSNAKMHDHFYTASPEEASAVAKTPGWRYEGAAWRNDGPMLTIPVWRFRHRKTGQHFYTTSRDEYGTVQAAGWVPEGVAFNAGGTTPVRRFYDRITGEHLYTASPTERPLLWRDEGIAFNV